MRRINMLEVRGKDPLKWVVIIQRRIVSSSYDLVN